MKFSEKLIQTSQPIFKEIMKHPFVKGISEGSVPKSALTFYVGQDFNYLNAFMKVYAAAIQKADSREQIELFMRQIDFTLHDEVDPHKVFCQVVGIDYLSLQHAKQAPMTYLYNEHMYNAMRTGDLIDVVAAMAPCPWSYHQMCLTLISEGKATDSNPFKEWIDFYAGSDTGEKDLSDQLFALLDQLAEKYDDEYLQGVEERFMKSMELEWEFWDQAYYQKDWKFVK